MPSTINCYWRAIRFFCEYTLSFEWNPRKVPKMKTNKKHPLILTKDEVNAYIYSFGIKFIFMQIQIVKWTFFIETIEKE